jgi:hypothetical protein
MSLHALHFNTKTPVDTTDILPSVLPNCRQKTSEFGLRFAVQNCTATQTRQMVKHDKHFEQFNSSVFIETSQFRN